MMLFYHRKTTDCKRPMVLIGGASDNSLMAGQVMGYSVHPNSVRNYQKELANKNQTEIGKVIKEATEVYMANYITIIHRRIAKARKILLIYT